MELKRLRAKLEQRKGKRQQLEQTIEKINKEIVTDKRQIIRHERALAIVKQVGLSTQKQLEYHLSEQVSLALEAVFDDPYKLKVNFQEKRGKTEVELLFCRRGMEFPPLGNAGGGAINVASLALRIAYWTMRQDKKSRSLFLLDEPFSRLKGEDANRRALGIVQEISKKLDLQIIMISDERIPRQDILSHADRVFEVGQNRKGISSVKAI